MEVRTAGKVYQCGKYGLNELADLQDWMQDRREEKIIKRARKIYGDNLPDKIYDEISKEVTLDDIGDAITSDLRAIGRLIFITLVKTYPDITYEQVQSGIDGVEEAVKILGDMSPASKPSKTKAKKKLAPAS